MSAIRLFRALNAVSHIGAVELGVVRMVRKGGAAKQRRVASDNACPARGGQS